MFKLMEVFEHLGRVCVVLRVEIVGVTHNGYVSISDESKDNTTDIFDGITTDELTYEGELPAYQKEDPRIKGRRFVGFDTNHVWNIENPESQTFEAVRLKTLQLAEELDMKGF